MKKDINILSKDNLICSNKRGVMMFVQRYSTNSQFSDILMSSDGTYLTGLWFEHSRDSKKHQSDLTFKNLLIFDQTKTWLDLYFSGQVPNFIPPYKINNLTPFRKQVIEIMKEIPYGNVVTYQDIANKIAKMNGISKMSAQAVGGAVGWNPICLIIPCHRVVGTSGSLTGYGGGIQNKVKLLELEKLDMSQFKIPTKGTAL